MSKQERLQACVRTGKELGYQWQRETLFFGLNPLARRIIFCMYALHWQKHMIYYYVVLVKCWKCTRSCSLLNMKVIPDMTIKKVWRTCLELSVTPPINKWINQSINKCALKDRFTSSQKGTCELLGAVEEEYGKGILEGVTIQQVS